MTLTSKATHYLNMLNHDEDFVIQSKEEIINYLTRQNIPPFEKVVEFALNYSGVILSVYMKEGETFISGLFTRRQIDTNEEIDCIKLNGQHYFYCGEHATAQFWFVISEKGEFCTYDNLDGSINVIASSFEQLIERYAMEDSVNIDNYYEHPPYFQLKSLEAFDQFFSVYIVETSDDPYSRWMANEEFIIHKGTWLDRPSHYIHVYARNKERCKELVKILEKEGII